MAYNLPKTIDRIVRDLKAFYQINNEEMYYTILDKAQCEVREKCTYDGWNGGQTGHALDLLIPFPLYCKIINEKDNYQQRIITDINEFHSYGNSDNGPNESIEEVFISSLPSDINELPVEQEAVVRIWPNGYLKAFISHRDVHKKEVSELAEALKGVGISGFVAHESIQATQEWQNEIENALRSMDIFIMYLKEGFHDSSYCDQEVGFALAKGMVIIALWRDRKYSPKGFSSKFQALKIYDTDMDNVTKQIADLLHSIPEQKRKFHKGLIAALCSSKSYSSTGLLIKNLDKYCEFTNSDIELLINAFNTNSQIHGYAWLGDFFSKIMNMHSNKKYKFGANKRSIEEQ